MVTILTSDRPNEKCTPSGPGEGEGGEPGRDGANCEFLGNVLIVQSSDKTITIPDDNVDGGSILFEFKTPVLFESLGLLDIDYATSITILTETDSGEMNELPPIAVELLGDNSFQVVGINEVNVKQLRVSFTRSGAVTDISFCYPSTGPTPVPATKTPPTPVPPINAQPTPVPPTRTPPTSGGVEPTPAIPTNAPPTPVPPTKTPPTPVPPTNAPPTPVPPTKTPPTPMPPTNAPPTPVPPTQTPPTPVPPTNAPPTPVPPTKTPPTPVPPTNAPPTPVPPTQTPPTPKPPTNAPPTPVPPTQTPPTPSTANECTPNSCSSDSRRHRRLCRQRMHPQLLFLRLRRHRRLFRLRMCRHCPLKHRLHLFRRQRRPQHLVLPQSHHQRLFLRLILQSLVQLPQMVQSRRLGSHRAFTSTQEDLLYLIRMASNGNPMKSTTILVNPARLTPKKTFLIQSGLICTRRSVMHKT